MVGLVSLTWLVFVACYMVSSKLGQGCESCVFCGRCVVVGRYALCTFAVQDLGVVLTTLCCFFFASWCPVQFTGERPGVLCVSHTHWCRCRCNASSVAGMVLVGMDPCCYRLKCMCVCMGLCVLACVRCNQRGCWQERFGLT